MYVSATREKKKRVVGSARIELGARPWQRQGKGILSAGITFEPDSIVTTYPMTRIFVSLFKSWTCTRFRPSFCPGAANITLDGTVPVVVNCALFKNKISVPGPVDVGVAIEQGVHNVTVEKSFGKKGGVAFSAILGHRSSLQQLRLKLRACRCCFV